MRKVSTGTERGCSENAEASMKKIITKAFHKNSLKEKHEKVRINGIMKAKQRTQIFQGI